MIDVATSDHLAKPRNSCQVSFVVDLEGIHFQDLITDSLSYKDLNGELSKALARCVETIAARSVLKAAWYHKIQPSSDDSGVQVFRPPAFQHLMPPLLQVPRRYIHPLPHSPEF